MDDLALADLSRMRSPADLCVKGLMEKTFSRPRAAPGVLKRRDFRRGSVSLP
jgi:hypothetical protein